MWWYFINTLSLSLCLINGLRRIQWYVARFLFTDSFRHISDPIRSMRSVLFPFGFATFICFGHDLLRSYTYSTSGPWLPNSIENNVTSNVRSAYTWTRTQTHISASSLILNMNLITHERYICLRLRAWKHGKLTHTPNKREKNANPKIVIYGNTCYISKFRCDPFTFLHTLGPCSFHTYTKFQHITSNRSIAQRMVESDGTPKTMCVYSYWTNQKSCQCVCDANNISSFNSISFFSPLNVTCMPNLLTWILNFNNGDASLLISISTWSNGWFFHISA